jgi:hypothetical protein
MKCQKELLRVVDRYANHLKKKVDEEMLEMAVTLDAEFDHSKPEIQKLLLEEVISRLHVEADQCDTQSLIQFTMKFSELLNQLMTRTLKDFTPLSVNEYLFTPLNEFPLSINVEKDHSKTPLGKIIILADMIVVRTNIGEVRYVPQDHFINDEITMGVLGHFITKLNTRSYISE